MAVTEGTGPSSLPAIDRLTSDLAGQTTSPRPPAPSTLPGALTPPAKKAPAPTKRTTATRGTSAAKPAAIPGLAGVNSNFDARLMALIAAAPGRITITSGLRSTAQQQKLWDAYQNGTGNLAAKPGTSYHEKGLAYDIGFENDATRRWAHANASRFGLVFPIKGEAWHVEPVETRGQALSAPAVQAGLKPITGVKATSGGAAGSSAGSTSGGMGAEQAVDPADAIAEYGYIAELANSVPDIKKVLTQAIEGGWSPARFTAAIQETKWWRTTTERQRQVELLKKTDPAEYRRQRQQMIDQFVITARNLGVEEGNQRIFILAERALSQGWDDDQIQRYLAADIKVKETGNTGLTATTVESLKEQAAQYGVPLSQQTLQMWTTQVLRGMVPAESFTAYLKEQAKSLFPGLARAIDSGVTVEQYVEPYRQIAAQTLERAPEEFDLSNPQMKRALYNTTKDGDRTQMSLSEFEKYLRGTADYRKTRQAQQTAAEFSTRITELFGATG